MNAHYRASRVWLPILCVLACSAHCWETDQFRQFFPSWRAQLLEIRDDNCTAERDFYFGGQGSFQGDNSHERNPGFFLANCLLANLPDFQTVEMSTVSLLLGLLPSILTLIGPTPDEVSLLALRRPILTILLAIPLPSLRPEDAGHKQASWLRKPVELTFKPGKLSRPPAWFPPIISVCEYSLAGLAVANMVYQAYQLAFWSITVSSIAIYSGPLPSTYGPWLWLILIGVMHFLSFWAFALRFEREPNSKQTKAPWLLRWFRNELTPCLYGEPMRLKPAHSSYLRLIVSFGQGISLMVVVTYATILLSSQIFISLADAVAILARFLLGVLVCRWILAFELRGMREVTSQDCSSAFEDSETMSQKGQITYLPSGESQVYQKIAR